MSEAEWYGKHLTEDEIVEDLLSRIEADPEALEGRTNWRAGYWFTAGARIRNWYGLWRKDCPLTTAPAGTWPPPPDADDVSGRIIDRVRKALADRPRPGADSGKAAVTRKKPKKAC